MLKNPYKLAKTNFNYFKQIKKQKEVKNTVGTMILFLSNIYPYTKNPSVKTLQDNPHLEIVFCILDAQNRPVVKSVFTVHNT